MVTALPAFDLDQVQTEYREANSYVDTGNQLKQEGYLAESEGCFVKAIESYQRLLAQLLTVAGGNKSLSLAKSKNLSPKQRVDQFQAVRQEAVNYIDKGKQLEQDDKLDEAIECYYKAIQTDQNLPWTYHSLGDLFSKTGQLDEAINCYCECIQLSPETPWSYHALGDTLCKKEMFDEALFFYHRAISLKPDLCWTHNALGGLYARRGDFKKAEQHYRAALNIEPNLEPAKASLAVVLEHLNQG